MLIVSSQRQGWSLDRFFPERFPVSALTMAVALIVFVSGAGPGSCEAFERTERIRNRFSDLRKKLSPVAKAKPKPVEVPASCQTIPAALPGTPPVTSGAKPSATPVAALPGTPPVTSAAKPSATPVATLPGTPPVTSGAKLPVTHATAVSTADLEEDFGKLLFVLDVDRREVSELREKVATLEKVISTMKKSGTVNGNEPVFPAGQEKRGPDEPACHDKNLSLALMAGWEKFSLSRDGGLGFKDDQGRGLVGVSKNLGRIDLAVFLNGWESNRFVPHDPSVRAVTELFKVYGAGDGTYSLTEASLNLKELVVSAAYSFGDPFRGAAGRRVIPRAGASVKRNTLRLGLTPLDSSDSPVFTALVRRGFFSGEFFAGLTAELNSIVSLSADGVYSFGGTTVKPTHTEIFEKYGDGTPTLAPDAARTAADRLSDKGLDFSSQGWSLRAATNLRFR